MAVAESELVIPACDGYPLAATLFEPERETDQWIVVNSATAVPRSYYARFARYLAGEGWRVVTYDYRGIGGSRPRRLRGFRARMRDWAQQDAAGVLDWVAARGASRIAAVGHSFGGQALGLLPRPELLAAAVLVGSQSGYWRLWDGWRKAQVAVFWHALVPGLCAVCGFFPGRVLGMGENSPADVAREWAAWGRRPGYVTEADGLGAGFARVACPIRSYSFSDDTFAPPRAVEALLGFYSAARVERRALSPRDLGVRTFGHWSFFRERFREPLWTEAAGWLREAVRPSTG